MPVTKCEPETTRKASRKSVKTQETALSALLAQTEEVSVPLDSLIKSPLNVRTVPYSAESVSELADSIKGVGLLQNLVVHALPSPLRASDCCRIWSCIPCLVTVTVSPQVVADWLHSTCWQSVASLRLTGLSV
ncbi:ParB-like nuclease domain [Shigella sonnei]|nr:ParB-like nuclease domain [Shigella sonnei]